MVFIRQDIRHVFYAQGAQKPRERADARAENGKQQAVYYDSADENRQHDGRLDAYIEAGRAEFVEHQGKDDGGWKSTDELLQADNDVVFQCPAKAALRE